MSCSWTVGLLKVVLTQMNFDQRNFTVVMPASHRLLLTCWLVYSPTSAVQRRQLPGAAFSRVVWLKGEKHTEIIHQPPKLTHFQTLQRFEHKRVWRRFLFFCQLVFTHVPSSLPSLDAVARLQLYIIPEWSIWGEVSALAIPQNSCIKYHPLQADELTSPLYLQRFMCSWDLFSAGFGDVDLLYWYFIFGKYFLLFLCSFY